jgi:thioesterase domain-containing protein
LALSTYGFLEGEIGVVRPLPESQLRAELGALVDRVMREQPARSDLFFHWAVDRGIIVSEHLQDWARQYLACFGQHCTMLAQGVPLPKFRAPLVVWRARDGFGSPVGSWEHAGAIASEYVIDGDHFAFLRPPGVLALAQQIADVLQHGCGAGASAPAVAR